MACMKLGSKTDAFQRQGRAWFRAEIHAVLLVEVSGQDWDMVCEFPVAMLKWHGLRSSSIVACSAQLACQVILLLKLARCPSISTRSDLYQVGCISDLALANFYANEEILTHIKGTVGEKALSQTCDDILSHAEELQITKRCIESLAVKANTDPNLFGWPIMEHGGPMQSPGGSVLWNGISTGARPKKSSSDWWYEDVSNLSLALYQRLISAMESRGVKQEIIAGSLTFYAKKYLPGLNRRKGTSESSSRLAPAPLAEEDQKLLLEEINRLLTMQKGLLDQATLEDLLMPNFSYSMETLYNVDCVQRILEHFLAVDQVTGGASPCSVDDGRFPKFQSLAAAVPEYARPLDDGLYRSIDIYLKSHPWLAESDKEQLCRLMDCQKLSLEACTHAAQNERLPLRVIVQVLFFEQLQLRTSIAGCFLVSDNLDGSRQLRSGLVGSTEGGGGGGWATAVRENQVLKVGMDSMRMRVSELEKECSNMRQEIEKLGRVKGSSTWEGVSKKFGFKIRSQMCSAQEGLC
ncbi:phototropic-responsive NPH3 family protein [Actinidia rufa]|uniref:Phototropic-responsive NPH3 family protein n=1 Tax=Actinidia rufa TaxID=165716 RepID=A0A7J0G5L4_9ERIC|nr:phototropic-responsive NPH3 family protein [Actinidia rufa]